METVYLETTFISYLVARPSRDLLVAAHQQATQELWANRRSAFENCISQVVIDEASAGDPAEVQRHWQSSAACLLWKSRRTPNRWPRPSWLRTSFRRTPSVTLRMLRWRLSTRLTIC